MSTSVNVIGAGLAGCEATWQLIRRNIHVDLFEMKPSKHSPAHHSDLFAELVCSNSLRSKQLSNAVGLLKEEMRKLNSLIMEAADYSEVPAGSSLAVDRNIFSEYITNKIKNHPLVTVHYIEVTKLNPEKINIVATGPLTSDDFSKYIFKYIGGNDSYLSFFDAAAPIVDASSIDYSKSFFASRYNKGEACYINCPMNREEYDFFFNELIGAEEAKLKDFDLSSQNKINVFEGCMPIEVMAKRGRETMLFGPMKPVGLVDPKTGKEPYAVVQLRQENLSKTMYNMVGFQTHLTFKEQKRVFSLIPALKNAEFLRYGVMHRNTFINSPNILSDNYSMKSNSNTFFAGQISGVEGYLESASSGLISGINAACVALGQNPVVFPASTAIGALARYVSTPNHNFQPMNVNFGIIDQQNINYKLKKSAKNEIISAKSLELIDILKKSNKFLQ